MYNHIKQLRLPYTIIDIGWWYQLSYPRLGSGRTDYAMTTANNEIVGDGNTPLALTDLRDIGRYVAKIIVDDRTLNKMVFAYNTVLTQNQIYDLLEEISEEKIQRNYVSTVTRCGCSMYADIFCHRSLKRPFTPECLQLGSLVRLIPSTLSNSFPDTWPKTNCHGVSVATTTLSTPST